MLKRLNKINFKLRIIIFPKIINLKYKEIIIKQIIFYRIQIIFRIHNNKADSDNPVSNLIVVVNKVQFLDKQDLVLIKITIKIARISNKSNP